MIQNSIETGCQIVDLYYNNTVSICIFEYCSSKATENNMIGSHWAYKHNEQYSTSQQGANPDGFRLFKEFLHLYIRSGTSNLMELKLHLVFNISKSFPQVQFVFIWLCNGALLLSLIIQVISTIFIELAITLWFCTGKMQNEVSSNTNRCFKDSLWSPSAAAVI